MGLALPEQYGGSEMTFLDLSILLEETGRACLPGPLFSTVVLGGMPILDSGSDAQKQEYLPKIAGGEAICTMAITEAGASYEPASIQVKAVADGDGYAISGTKLFVPDAAAADYMLVVARTSDAAEGITVFIVDAKSSGITCNALKSIASDKLCEVVFDKVKVSKDNILGAVDKGWEVVEKALQKATIAKCCTIVGAMGQVLEMTVDYAKERKQYDRPIGSFQVIQHYCANMAIDLEGCRYSTYQAAWKLSEDKPCREEAAIAKSYINDAFERFIAYSHQIHGAIGVTIDHDLQYYTKRAKAGTLTYGGSEYQREIIAREMGL
jgi:alkylation response protein AidB-like acyl-CoA dehydrogenase